MARAPYLKALAFYPMGDAWSGGGLFTGSRTYWLHGRSLHPGVRESGEVTEDPATDPRRWSWDVYRIRLRRDGWLDVGLERRNGRIRNHSWEKPLPDGWTLRKVSQATSVGAALPGKGYGWEAHQLFHVKTGAGQDFPGWEWADRDGDRLVWAEGGKLWAGTLTRDGLSQPVMLHDFNGMAFEPIAAPY